MDRVVDARGRSCPEPVILARKALVEVKKGEVEVLVSNRTAQENVARMAKNLGWAVSVEEDERYYRLVLTKG